jgi:surface carbohydrate biosynthesis protein (TIGR04326 family)
MIAVNGNVARNELILSGYPVDKLVEVEALRYSYLENRISSHRYKDQHPDTYDNILILGDYNHSDTEALVALVSNAMSYIDREIYVHFKPHPNYSIRAENYPNLRIVFEDQPLESVLPKFHLAIASNKTTAAVEAYLTGLRIIVMLDNDDLNFSPLRGVDGVSFVSNGFDLARILTNKNCLKNKKDRSEFFFLNSDLTMWRKVLQDL